ncbi:hypothetical protein V8F20_009711 [Naviculisporaceae sp. PSN 640]
MSQPHQAIKSFAFQLEVEFFAQARWEDRKATIFAKSLVCPRPGCNCTWDIANDDPEENAKSLRCGLANALDRAGIPAAISDVHSGLTAWDPFTTWLVDNAEHHLSSQVEKMLLDEFYPIRLISRLINICEPTPFAGEIEMVFNTIKSVCLVESGAELNCSTRVRVFRTNPTMSAIEPWDSLDLMNIGMACLMYEKAMLQMIPLAPRNTSSATGITAPSIDNNTDEQTRNYMLGIKDGKRASWATIYEYLNNNAHETGKTPAQAAEWLIRFLKSFDNTRAWTFRPLIAPGFTVSGAFEFRLAAGTVDPQWACHWVSFAIGFVISTSSEAYMSYSKHKCDGFDTRPDRVNGNNDLGLSDLQDCIRRSWRVCNIRSGSGQLISQRLQAMLLDPLMVSQSENDT